MKEHDITNVPIEKALYICISERKLFRNVFFKVKPNWFLRVIYPKDSWLFVSPTVEIDGGLFFWHPWMTRVYAKNGTNVTIRQLTTLGNLGKKDPNALVTIGDNVDIGGNVTIIGNVKIGNNVNIGAGSVITKDIPANCNVVGNPAYIIRRNGVRCHEKI